jgi:hypothetical protein
MQELDGNLRVDYPGGVSSELRVGFLQRLAIYSRADVDFFNIFRSSEFMSTNFLTSAKMK